MVNEADKSPERSFELERAELKAVLNSGIFKRAPLLYSFLSYVCEKRFRGESEQIKEYSIAIEALGRAANFDHTTDSIVRVEAHRLRKRLREYYEKEGAAHALRIRIPPGAYVPVFEIQKRSEQSPSGQNGAATSAEVGPVATAESAVATRPGTSADPARSLQDGLGASPQGESARPRMAFRLTLAGLAIAAVAAIVLSPPDTESPAGSVSASAGIVSDDLANTGPAGGAVPEGTTGTGAAVRVSAGMTQTPYVDEFGRPWDGDRYFQGGEAVETPSKYIARWPDPTIFQTYREGNFRYDIPLDPGVYELRLYFAETAFGPGNPAGSAESARIFNVILNGGMLLDAFDILADANGPNTADVKVFKDIFPADDGFLRLEFKSLNHRAMLNALEILPGTPGVLQPVRLLAGRSSYYHDSRGREWLADHYFDSGEDVLRRKRVNGTSDPNLYGGERYGNFTYSLPVDRGSYRLTLLFAETWFGTSNPGRNGTGSRIFDVYCNGVALLKDFDVYKEAGGENIALEKTFHNLSPNAQGKIVLSFVPVTNYAMINAIELVDESSLEGHPSAVSHARERAGKR